MAEYVAVCRTITNKSRTAVFEFLLEDEPLVQRVTMKMPLSKINKKNAYILTFPEFFHKRSQILQEIP